MRKNMQINFSSQNVSIHSTYIECNFFTMLQYKSKDLAQVCFIKDITLAKLIRHIKRMR